MLHSQLHTFFILLLKTCKSSKIYWTQLLNRYPHLHIKISNNAEVALKRLGKFDLNTMCPNYIINHRGRNAAQYRVNIITCEIHTKKTYMF